LPKSTKSFKIEIKKRLIHGRENVPKFLFNKIIREKFLYKLTIENGEYTSTKLTNEQIIHELKLKLKEEAQEAYETSNANDLLEELSDLLEVIDGLLQASYLTMSDLSNAKETKQFSRGKLRTYEKILTVNIPDSKPFLDTISQLREHPERYPEL
jgi:predicted house-cleaning noncanonical NTP pyrophosphatase (MazG superfamily)